MAATNKNCTGEIKCYNSIKLIFQESKWILLWTLGVPEGKFESKGMLAVIVLSELVCHYAFNNNFGNKIIFPESALETKMGHALSFNPWRP